MSPLRLRVLRQTQGGAYALPLWYQAANDLHTWLQGGGGGGGIPGGVSGSGFRVQGPGSNQLQHPLDRGLVKSKTENPRSLQEDS